MPEYVILAASLIVVTLLIVARFRLKIASTKVLLSLIAILLLLTLIFDFYLTSLPIVIYNNNSILNIKIATIPIEDFSYTIAVAIIVPSLFKYFNEKE